MPKQKRRDGWERLRQAAPERVRSVADGHIRFVSTDSLESGREFLVGVGERFPADGRVESGNSRADESLLTGNVALVAKKPGDGVIAGSVNVDAVRHVKATHTGSDTVLAQIFARVERALRNRSPLEQWMGGVTRIILPSVMAIALVTFGVCWLGEFADAGVALMRAVTVLVIACPSAIALATPLAVTTAPPQGAASS